MHITVTIEMSSNLILPTPIMFHIDTAHLKKVILPWMFEHFQLSLNRCAQNPDHCYLTIGVLVVPGSQSCCSINAFFLDYSTFVLIETQTSCTEVVLQMLNQDCGSSLRLIIIVCINSCCFIISIFAK